MTRQSLARAAVGSFALVLAACGSSSATAPTSATAPLSVAAASPAPPAVDAGLLAILDADIQDEYRAEAIYGGVLLDFGPETRPFANIIVAERRHAAAVAGLFTARGLAVPASQWSPANVPRSPTLREACAAGVANETANVALYDSQLGTSLPDDVVRVIQSNRAASLENHLPAFERCR